MQTVKRVKGTVALTVVVLLCTVLFSLLSLGPAGAAAGETVRVSTSSSGAQADGGYKGNNSSDKPSMSSDGRYVAFYSGASNLVEGDTNATVDVFRKDLVTGETVRASTSSAGAQGDQDSFLPSISSDGRYVAFASWATGLVEGDTNATVDVFRKDLETGETVRASTSSAGAQGGYGGSSYGSSMSSDGRYVAFESEASNLVEGDTNGKMDVFRKDLETGETVRASTSSAGAQGDRYSCGYSISSDGRYVAFYSEASNLVEGDDTYGCQNVFRKDLTTGEILRADTTSSGEQGGDSWESDNPSISSDGRYVAFMSWGHLVEGDTNSTSDIFRKDLETGETLLVSTSSYGTQGNGECDETSMSSDGRYVTFSTWSTNLVEGDTNSMSDIFRKDCATGETVRVSTSSSGEQGDDDVPYYCAPISSSGRFVAFASKATNLVEGDTNGDEHLEYGQDIFRKEVTGPPLITSISPTSGYQGKTVKVKIKGENTHFLDGTSVATFSGTGITLHSTHVTDATHATAKITIHWSAPTEARDVSVTTGSETPTPLASGFTVEPYAYGSVVAWGNNDYGQCDVPGPNRDFVSVEAGAYHSLGLKSNGTVVAWGRNDYGQCDDPGSPPYPTFVSGMAAGGYHSIYLWSDGYVTAEGDNTYGQCDVPGQPPSAHIVDVAAGEYHSLYLYSDGTVTAMGDNTYGQCDVPDLPTPPFPSPGGHFVSVEAGAYHSLGLLSDGSVVAWGRNDYGQCDVPDIGASPDPDAGVVALAAGRYHSLVLMWGGQVLGWGNNDYGQCDDYDGPVSPDHGVVALAAGGYHNLLSVGNMGAWGNNDYGQCNVPAPDNGFVAVAAGEYHSLAIQNGELYNTPGGDNVMVDLGSSSSITFAEVTTAGNTTSTPQSNPDIPSYQVLAGSCCDMNTTATFAGKITVSLPYDEGAVTVPEDQLKMLHQEGDTWVGVTKGVDTENNIVTGEVDSLSAFVIAWSTASSPTVNSITPNGLGNGKGNKNAAVKISGTGFVPASKTKVMIIQSGVLKPKKKAAKKVVVVDANTITCSLNLTSALPGDWDVVVTNPDKTTATLTGGLKVNPHPTIDKPVKPNTNPTPPSGSATALNPVSVKLTGANFTVPAPPAPGATLKVYKISKRIETDLLISNLVVTSNTITFDLDQRGAAVGTWKGKVVNPDGGIGEFKFKVTK